MGEARLCAENTLWPASFIVSHPLIQTHERFFEQCQQAVSFL